MKFLYKFIVFVISLVVVFASLYVYVEDLNHIPTETMGISVNFTKENYSGCDNVTIYLNVTCYNGFSEFKDHTYPENVYLTLVYLGNSTKDVNKYIYKTPRHTVVVQGNPYLNWSGSVCSHPTVNLPFNLSNKHPDDEIIWNYAQTNNTQGFYAYSFANVLGPALTVNGHQLDSKRVNMNPRSPLELNYPYIYV